MSQHRIEANEPGVFVDRRALDDCNGVATEGLARDIKAVGERSVSECPSPALGL